MPEADSRQVHRVPAQIDLLLAASVPCVSIRISPFPREFFSKVAIGFLVFKYSILQYSLLCNVIQILVLEI